MIARDLQQSLRIVQAQCDDHGAAVRTLVGEVDALLGEVQALRAERLVWRGERAVIADTLATFAAATLSISSVQPLLQLAESLKVSLPALTDAVSLHAASRASALVCGCDAGANHFCEQHRPNAKERP